MGFTGYTDRFVLSVPLCESISALRQMDVVRICATELGRFSCTISWEPCAYQRQIHQLISTILRYTPPNFTWLKSELLLSSYLNTAAETCVADP